MKLRGFDLERTGITLGDRLERLFVLVTLAWVWCLRVGVDAALQRPIPIKAHGRQAMSLVTYGWERLAHALRWVSPTASAFITLLNCAFSAPDGTGEQGVRY